MSRFLLKKSMIRTSKVSKKDFPTLPDELWIAILTAALEPVVILDEYCLPSNLEQFYYATTCPDSTSIAKAAANSARRMRHSLYLVCRRLNIIMHSIPKREDYIWLRVGAKALPTRAPVLECPSVLTDGQNSTYGRLDIEITIGDVSPMTISFTKPISTYRLFVKKGPKGLVKFYDLSSLVPKCDTLRVVHLGLEHCMPNPAIHHTPNMVGQLFNGLGTLSLSFGVKTTRDILYFHLTLPKLRTLFLKFSEVGLESYALDGWLLPSLNVFSFHTVIGPHDIGSQHTIPQFISIFISKYGPQLHGLRLMTDHRGFFDESGAVIPMEVDRMREFWEFFTNLTALSMDLKSLWEQIESSTVEAREIIRAVFSQLQYLAHVESSPLVSSVDGIQGALLLCGPKLETFTIVTYDGRTLGSSWLSSGRHSGLLERLIERCASVSVKFLDVHGRPLTMDMTPS